MKERELFKWWLPPRWGKGKPYLSSWRMSQEEAQARGAIRPEPSTRLTVPVPQTPEEDAELKAQTDTSLFLRRPK